MKLLIFRNAFSSFIKLRWVYIPQSILTMIFVILTVVTGKFSENEDISLICIIVTISILLVQISLLNIQYFSYVFYEKRSLGIFELELRAGCSKKQIFFERLCLNIVISITVIFVCIALFAAIAIPISNSYNRINYLYCFSFFGVIIFDFILKGLLTLFVGINRPKIAVAITSFIVAIGVLNPALASATNKINTITMEPDKEDANDEYFKNLTVDYFGVDFKTLYLASKVMEIEKSYQDGLLSSMKNSLTNIDENYINSLTAKSGLKGFDYKDDGEYSGNRINSVISMWSMFGLSTDKIFEMSNTTDGAYLWNDTYNKFDNYELIGDINYESVLGPQGEAFYNSVLVTNSSKDYTEDWEQSYAIEGPDVNGNSKNAYLNFKSEIKNLSVSDQYQDEWSRIVPLVLDIYQSSIADSYYGNSDSTDTPIYSDLLRVRIESNWSPNKVVEYLKNVSPYISQLRTILLMLATMNNMYTIFNFLEDYDSPKQTTSVDFSWMQKINDSKFFEADYVQKYVNKWFKLLTRKSKTTYLNPFIAYNSMLFNMGISMEKNIFYNNDILSASKAISPYGPIKVNLTYASINGSETNFYDLNELSFNEGLYYNIPTMFVVPIILSVILMVIGWFLLRKKFII